MINMRHKHREGSLRVKFVQFVRLVCAGGSAFNGLTRIEMIC